MKILIYHSIGNTWFKTDHIIFSQDHTKIIFVSNDIVCEYGVDRVIEIKDNEEDY